MGAIASKIIVNGILLGTSVMCLRRCQKPLRFAKACFRMFCCYSVIAITSAIIDVERLRIAEEITWAWCYAFGLPLLATDLTTTSTNAPEIAPLHLLVPIYTVIAYHAYPAKVDPVLLATSHVISFLYLAVNSAFRGSLTRLVISYVHFHTILSLGIAGPMPQNFWSLMMALSNILTLYIL